jgi:hypothetical protein
MRWAWFTLAVVVVALVIVGGLYATGPTCKSSRTGEYFTPTGDQRCLSGQRTTLRERISGAITG